MALYRDEGVVMRTQKLGEADRIITVFTRKNGVQRFVAKGVRKTSSKFGATLEPFMLVDFQCFEGRSLDTITQAQLIAPFGSEIIKNYEFYLSANMVVEATERLNEGEAAIEQYQLLVGALRALARQVIDSQIIRDAYLTRAIALAGWAPELSNCVVCSSQENLVALSINSGGAVCKSCRPAGAFTVMPGTIQLLNSYLQGDWKQSLSATGGAYQQASGFIAAYLQWHLERNLKSFSLSHRTLTTG